MMDLDVFSLVLSWDDDVNIRSRYVDGEGMNLVGKWMDLGEGNG